MFLENNYRLFREYFNIIAGGTYSYHGALTFKDYVYLC
jgi:hypothetical protein